MNVYTINVDATFAFEVTQYSVCDAEPGPFCFEQVTVGEEL